MNKTKIGFSLLGIALIGGGITLSTSLTSCSNKNEIGQHVNKLYDELIQIQKNYIDPSPYNISTYEGMFLFMKNTYNHIYNFNYWASAKINDVAEMFSIFPSRGNYTIDINKFEEEVEGYVYIIEKIYLRFTTNIYVTFEQQEIPVFTMNDCVSSAKYFDDVDISYSGFIVGFGMMNVCNDNRFFGDYTNEVYTCDDMEDYFLISSPSLINSVGILKADFPNLTISLA
ncbi:MAG: hypothetical protein LBS95_00200 [Mycoplasmataceae bacterium]|nr:hypothetical protein [Mycoplasmataceae bacterium]